MSVTCTEPGQVARPPPVQNSDLTAFSAVVRWNAPIDPNGEITRYNVIFVALSKPDRSLPGSRRKRQNSALDLQVECIIGGSGNINRTIVLNGNPPQTFATLTELSELPLLTMSELDACVLVLSTGHCI